MASLYPSGSGAAGGSGSLPFAGGLDDIPPLSDTSIAAVPGLPFTPQPPDPVLPDPVATFPSVPTAANPNHPPSVYQVPDPQSVFLPPKPTVVVPPKAAAPIVFAPAAPVISTPVAVAAAPSPTAANLFTPQQAPPLVPVNQLANPVVANSAIASTAATNPAVAKPLTTSHQPVPGFTAPSQTAPAASRNPPPPANPPANTLSDEELAKLDLLDPSRKVPPPRAVPAGKPAVKPAAQSATRHVAHEVEDAAAGWERTVRGGAGLLSIIGLLIGGLGIWNKDEGEEKHSKLGSTMLFVASAVTLCCTLFAGKDAFIGGKSTGLTR